MSRPLAMFVMVLAGCQAPSIPVGYVPLDEPRPTSAAAVASSGNRFEIREHENPEGATVDFWAEAIQRELVEARGYELIRSAAVVSTDDVVGHELLFRTEVQLQEYQYLVTVYVEDDRLVVFEAGGESAAFEADLDRVRDAIRRAGW